MKKRLLSLLILVCMALSLLPGTAWASVGDLLHNTPAENQALLDELAAMTGGTTEEARTMLEQLGLLDEKGRLKTDYTLSLDGKEYTLDEMEALLSDPSTDLSQVGYVDGTPIALGDLKTILEIERELQRIQETYFSGTTFSEESLQSLNSLLDQLQTQGLELQAAAGAPVSFLRGKAVDVSSLQEIPLETGYNYGYSGYFSIHHNTQSGETVSFDLTLDPGSLGDLLERVEVSVTVPTAGTISVELTRDNPTATWSCTLPATETGGSNSVRIQVCAVRDSYAAAEPGFYGNLAGALHFSNPTGGLVFWNGSDYTDRHTVMLTSSAGVPGDVSDTEASVSTPMTIQNDGTPNGDEWSQVRFSFLDGDGTRVRQIDSLRQLMQNSLQDASGNPVAINEVNAVKFQVSGELVQTTDTGIKFTTIPNFYFPPDISKDYWYLPLNSADTSKDYTHRLVNGEMVLEWEEMPLAEEMEDNSPSAFRFQGWSAAADAIPYGLFFEDPFSHGYAPAYPHSGTGTVQNCVVELLDDSTQPVLHSVTAPEGTYYPGQRVPVTLRFSELVRVADGTVITVNGAEFTADQLYMNTVGNDLVLWYPVQGVDGTSLTVSFGDGSGSGVTDFFGNPVDISGKPVEGAAIEGIRMRGGVNDLSASYENGQIVFALDADRSGQYGTLYANYDTSGSGEAPFRVLLYEQDAYGTYGTPKETIQVYMPASEGEPFSIAPYPVDLQSKAQVYYAYVQANEGTRDNPQWVDAVWSYHQINIAAKVSAEFVTVDPESDPANYTLSLGEDYRPTLTATITNSTGNPPTYVSGSWGSTDEDIATVTTNSDYTGTVVLTGKKVGQVQFYFNADNGTPEDPSDDEKGYSEPYTVTAGDSLALVIPSNASTIIIRQGGPATVLWSSNANLVAPDAQFEYTIELFSGYYETLEELENVQWSRLVTADQNSNSAEIDYGFNDLSDGDTPAYTVRVSMPHPDGESSDVRLSALAWIIVRPKPVQAEILTPKNDTILDETSDGAGQLEVSFRLNNFYPLRQKATLELTRIEEDGTVTSVASEEIQINGEGFDESTMIYVPDSSKWFNVEPVKKGHLRDIYQAVLTVTDQSGTYDRETSTTDSIYLYVYNADALHLVDGEGNDLSSSSLVVSNEDLADELPTDTDSILALREQLLLQAEVSINYEEYNWDSIRDTFQWKVSKLYPEEPGIDLNYKQGGLYENIDHFSFTEYLPDTVLLVTPDSEEEKLDGYYGRVSATHSATGNLTNTNVYFTSLKNKLFLFQVLPAAKTTLDAGGLVRGETNEDGVLALYTTRTIIDDVSFRSEYEGEVYLGTIPKEELRSDEGDATRLELYPINTVILRPAGKVELTLLKPDGSPLANSQVTIRGGVYKNGGYCESAEMGPDAESLDAGSVGQTYTTDETGKLTIYYDSTQF